MVAKCFLRGAHSFSGADIARKFDRATFLFFDLSSQDVGEGIEDRIHAL